VPGSIAGLYVVPAKDCRVANLGTSDKWLEGARATFVLHGIPEAVVLV
jgi:hypothetical protein